MNGYLVSTDDDAQDDSIGQTEVFDSAVNALQEMMADAGITDYSVEDTARVDCIYKASIFEVLRASKPGSQPASLVTSPDVSTSNQIKRPPRVYGPKVHYRIVYKERGESLHSMTRLRQIKLPLSYRLCMTSLKVI